MTEIPKNKEEGKKALDAESVGATDCEPTVNASNNTPMETLELQNKQLMEAYQTIKQHEHHLNLANQKMEKLIKDLQTKNDELRSFAHLVSHDLKSPLNVVFLAVEMAKLAEEPLEEGMQENLEMIYSSADHMKTTIDTYLDYAVSSVHDDRREPLNLNKLVSKTLEYLEPVDNISVQIEEMPIVNYDPVPFEKLLINLVDNALKHNDKQQCKIRIASVEKENHVLISVADNGPGISDEDQQHIFDPYLSIGKGKGNSTGLGLSLVKKIVERNKGEIWLESSMGKGTTFYFTIPKE